MTYLNLLMASVMFLSGNVLAGFVALTGWVVCLCFETIDEDLEDELEDLA